MKITFRTAMAAYVVFALVAGVFLTGRVRLAVWILLGGLAAKTWIARAARW